MAWIAVSCPQCGTPLPRLALWRSVKCDSCGSLITKTESVVTRDLFHQALNRARRESAGLDALLCGGCRYHLIQMLGIGEISQVYLARRIDSLPFLATIKLSTATAAASLFSHEARVLRPMEPVLISHDSCRRRFRKESWKETMASRLWCCGIQAVFGVAWMP